MYHNSLNNNNIILNQIHSNDDEFSIREYLPPLSSGDFGLLSFDENIKWVSIKGGKGININIDTSQNIIFDIEFPEINIPDPFNNTNLYFQENKLNSSSSIIIDVLAKALPVINASLIIDLKACLHCFL